MVSLIYFFNVDVKSVSHRYNERVVSAGYEGVFGFGVCCLVKALVINHLLNTIHETQNTLFMDWNAIAFLSNWGIRQTYR